MQNKQTLDCSFCVDRFGDFFYVQRIGKSIYNRKIQKGNSIRFEKFYSKDTRTLQLSKEFKLQYVQDTILWQAIIVQDY